MKRLTVLFLILTLLTAVAGAMASQSSPEDAAKAVVPSNAQFLRTRQDDGMTVYLFETPDGTRYEVDVNPATSSVVHLELEAKDKRGGASVVLTEDQVRQALLAVYPGADVSLIHQDKDNGRYEYDLHFSTSAFIGRAELNAETGAFLEAELDYTTAALAGAQGPLTAEQARAFVLSLVDGSRITEFETDREDGRTVFEGELRSDSGSYEFVIDAETGRVLEWEVER